MEEGGCGVDVDMLVRIIGIRGLLDWDYLGCISGLNSSLNPKLVLFLWIDELELQ